MMRSNKDEDIPINNNIPFLLDEWRISEISFKHCYYIEDDPKIRKDITESGWAFWYCRLINDDPEVRKNITHSYWARRYCKDIRKCEEMKKNITMKDEKINYYEIFSYLQFHYKNIPRNYNLDNVITVFHGPGKNVPFSEYCCVFE